MSWLNIVKPSNQGKYQFNLSIGARSVSQSNVIAQTNPTEPVKLVRFDKNRIVEDGALNIFAALHWRYGVCPEILERDPEKRRIIDWAETIDERPLARVVDGKGGTGKTRLAYEVALELQDRGWICAFAMDGELKHFSCSGAPGVFLIIDYPEERSDWEHIVQFLARCSNTGEVKVRLLILTRDNFESIRRDMAAAQDRIGISSLASLGVLSTNAAATVIENTIDTVAEVSGRTLPRCDQSEFSDWLGANPEHRRPLFCMAAGVHYVLDSRSRTFDMLHGDIVNALVDREVRRIDQTSRAIGLPEPALGYFLALATASGGLSSQMIDELRHPDYNIVRDTTLDVFSALTATHWWDHETDMLNAVHPDPIGAAFVDRVWSLVPRAVSAKWRDAIIGAVN